MYCGKVQRSKGHENHEGARNTHFGWKTLWLYVFQHTWCQNYAKLSIPIPALKLSIKILRYLVYTNPIPSKVT